MRGLIAAPQSQCFARAPALAVLACAFSGMKIRWISILFREVSGLAMLRIGIVAGESSGDQLGASLIMALQARCPDCAFEGMAGPRMVEAGCKPIASIDELSVMGIVEVLRHYPALRALRERLVRHFCADPPDIFIGIDVPDFVLNIERRLKDRGIKTVHYVSPQVWAWRQGRAAKIARSVDLLLAIFPFEVAFFARHGVPIRFVGHPLADEIPISTQRDQYRTKFGISPGQRVIALLPGSRRQEVARLTKHFVGAAGECYRRHQDLIFLAAPLDRSGAEQIMAAQRTLAPYLPLRILAGQARGVLGASDAALVASGTVTMEGLFLGAPMVVAYRLSSLSHFLLKRLVKVRFIAMPNILADRQVVPEFVQGQVKPDKLADALLAWLDDPDRVAQYRSLCTDLHTQLSKDAAAQSAEAVLDLVRAESGPAAPSGRLN